MDLDEAIMLAVATGAAARMNPNGLALKRPEMAAYLQLVDRLGRTYSGLDARMLEIAPGSQERQQLLADQIRRSGATNNRSILRESRTVLQEVLARTPQAAVAIFANIDTVQQALTTIERKLEVRQNGHK